MDKFDSMFWSEIPSNILSLRRVIQLLLKCSLAGRSLGSDSGIPFSKISGFLFKKKIILSVLFPSLEHPFVLKSLYLFLQFL